MWFVVAAQAIFTTVGWVLVIVPPHNLFLDLFIVTLAISNTFLLVEAIGDLP